MNISEFVAELEAIKAEHGDLDVETYDAIGYRKEAWKPEIAYRLILKGREHSPRFWNAYLPAEERESRKGTKVCKV